jgi:hypothetical protein
MKIKNKFERFFWYILFVVMFFCVPIAKKASAATDCGSQKNCECYTVNSIGVNSKYSEACSSSEEACLSACDKQGNGVVKYRFDMNPIYPKDIKIQQANTSAQANTPTPTKQQVFDYKLLESFPGFYNKNSVMSDLPGLVLSLYKFGIWTVGIAGLFMMVVGGIMYMGSAGNNSTATSAKGIITDSLIGIVAALAAYLVLYVINPDLTTINLKFTAVSIEEPSLTASEYVAIPGQLSDVVAKQRLSAAGIGVKNNVCANVGDSNCTTLEGIPAKAINGLIAMKNSCGSCSFFVTGGTEGGHKSHGPGRPMIDVRYTQDIRNFLASTKNSKAYAQYGLSQVCTLETDLVSVSYNRSYEKQCKDPSGEPHFHLSFGL